LRSQRPTSDSFAHLVHRRSAYDVKTKLRPHHRTDTAGRELPGGILELRHELAAGGHTERSAGDFRAWILRVARGELREPGTGGAGLWQQLVRLSPLLCIRSAGGRRVARRAGLPPLPPGVLGQSTLAPPVCPA